MLTITIFATLTQVKVLRQGPNSLGDGTRPQAALLKSRRGRGVLAPRSRPVALFFLICFLIEIKIFRTYFSSRIKSVIIPPIKNFKSFKNMSTSVPNIPSSYLSPVGQVLRENLSKEVDNLHAVFMEQDEKRDKIYKLTKKVSNLHAKTLFDIMSGQFEHVNEHMGNMRSLITEALISIQKDKNGTIIDKTLREANLSHTIEDFTTTVILNEFFKTGIILPHSSTLVQPCSDSEYLGACLNFAQHLSRYSVGRARVFDTLSISICKEVVDDLMEKMLQFDLRNGPLRRKYDGLKYVLRKLETIMYELSLLDSHNHTNNDASSSDDMNKNIKNNKNNGNGNSNGNNDNKEEVNNNKRARTGSYDSASNLVPEVIGSTTPTPTSSTNKHANTTSNGRIDSQSFDSIRERMEQYDKLREEVIKGSRDVQKLSKQAIFSVHRNKLDSAEEQLQKAISLANPLHAIVKEHPTLRDGSFSNSLEEWAEAELTLGWVLHGQVKSMGSMRHMDIRP